MHTLLTVGIAVWMAQASTAREDCLRQGGKWQSVKGETGCLIRGKREGEWRRTLLGGQLSEVSNWKRNVLVGPFTRYHDTCRVAERGAYENGLREGPWTYFNPAGAKTSEGSFRRGKKEGVWVDYDGQQPPKKRLEGPFVNGVPQGIFTEYALSGAKWREVEFHNGKRVSPEEDACLAKKGTWKLEEDLSAEGCVLNGEREGNWKGYYADGKTKWQAPFRHGKRHGIQLDFHPSGRLLREGEYDEAYPIGRHEFRGEDGRLYGVSDVTNGYGIWRAWHSNGKQSEEIRFENGCAAELKEFSEEGRLRSRYTFRNCVIDGPCELYHPNGVLESKGQFRQNLADGLWQGFAANGELSWEGSYRDGKRWGQWRYFRPGKRLSEVGRMEDDLSEGTWTQYGVEGKPSAIGARVAGKNEGPWKVFWSTGEPWREVQYRKGESQESGERACTAMSGTWVEDTEKRTMGCRVCRAREDGSVEEVGVGVWTYWHPTGELEKQGPLVEGKPTGEWSFFHDNGVVMMRGGLDAGVETGRWTGQWRTGAKRFQGQYVNGKPDGVWTTWAPDGGVISSGRYVAGEKTGPWSFAGE